MRFRNDDWLRFLVLMIRSSPNMEKLKLVCFEEHLTDLDDDLFYVTMQDCSDIWLEHLIELEISVFGNKKFDLEIVKLILAKSPNLKTVRLMVHNKEDELKLLEALLPSPRASPMVEIIVDCVGAKEESG
ncbi:F-box/FBD/LRR-repeat protein At1g13570-like [Rutidosis leptorrhynchoides]|uniref:F-box/FBD/LRR-repeat protein At1g13570-like n=1 Tax=Rutidosis leptorrhynchoides TaxID=125765 RepID=UPI003A9A03A4